MPENVPQVGKLCGSDAHRDAIHVAIAPVYASENLPVGAHVALCPGTTDQVYEVTDIDEAIGIIDPFLSGGVRRGDRCWLFLYPGTITSLRHVWSHPAFKVRVPTAQLVESERS